MNMTAAAKATAIMLGGILMYVMVVLIVFFDTNSIGLAIIVGLSGTIFVVLAGVVIYVLWTGLYEYFMDRK